MKLGSIKGERKKSLEDLARLQRARTYEFYHILLKALQKTSVTGHTIPFQYSTYEYWAKTVPGKASVMVATYSAEIIAIPKLKNAILKMVDAKEKYVKAGES